MTINTRTQYKIIVEEYKDLSSINVTLLSRDHKEVIEILKNLDHINAEDTIDHFIEKFNINDHSKIVDIIYNNEGNVIHREELTVREYKDF
jgi:hypothetical protein